MPSSGRRRSSSSGKSGTCICEGRLAKNSHQTRRRRLPLVTAALILLSTFTTATACTSSFPHLLPRRDLSPTSQPLPGPSLFHRRSPSPQAAGIVLADPNADSASTTTPLIEEVNALPDGYAFPQPFDAVLGVNFTSTSCPSFFNRFLADPQFRACSPLSLLLETSTSFFKAMQDPTLLSPILDQICSAGADTCLDIMNQYAIQIDQSGTCGPDLRQGNALAVSALNGFRNYKLYYQAGCLKDSNTGEYCFAEAANATTPSDLYIYYLPGGTSLPSGEKPTCNRCSKSVMSTFSNYASNSTLRISETYINARNVIALSCGPSFAPMVAATTVTAGSMQRAFLSAAGMLMPLLAAACFVAGTC
ncbi:hypothetical protein P389DRAFT_36524 [Cystobasidium minutum MCA 4210]|uniref:uncharacterized protein n=1 Tax=Cystobasidium minutum MCA 4210 TaxID=1397322 RepID=UPI0034CFFF99|eukprot:jgi/Rhomi1/36524/CE36523_1730